MKISAIQARQIFDSRGFPTVECDVRLDNGAIGRAAVPSGASTGSGEALELRDGGDVLGGKGVSRAVENCNTVIAETLIGSDPTDQRTIDGTMIDLDGTDNKSHLGANATLAVSLAVARAAAVGQNIPLFQHVAQLAGSQSVSLPLPMLNILNGGKHAEGSTDIQEFMIMPVGAATFNDALRMASDVYHRLGKVLREKSYATTVGDEGGYAPAVAGGSDEALELIESAIKAAGYTLGTDISLALDVASSELWQDGNYNFSRENHVFTTEELIERYAQLITDHKIVSIEDGLAEADWDGWQMLTSKVGGQIQLVGDDLLVTNTKLLERAIAEKSANAILIKPNQIGTLSETIEAVQMAQRAGWRTVMSHRSGETEDSTIAHLAVGLNTGQIKTGSFSRSDRIAKYNELIRIAELASTAQLARPFDR